MVYEDRTQVELKLLQLVEEVRQLLTDWVNPGSMAIRGGEHEQ
jgi:hypothetical protein